MLKKERAEKLKVELAAKESSEIRQRPQINDRSKKLTRDICDMQQWEQEKIAKREGRQNMKALEQDLECSFAPTLNKRTEKLTASRNRPRSASLGPRGQQNHSNIKYLSVGGLHLNKLGIKSIYDLKEITYIGFTSVILNLFKIRNKINETVKKIIEFNPDILFSVDSPDFTLRVAEKVKSINPNIKTIHYVAPQVWVWREGRVKNFKGFLDYVLLLSLIHISEPTRPY